MKGGVPLVREDHDFSDPSPPILYSSSEPEKGSETKVSTKTGAWHDITAIAKYIRLHQHHFWKHMAAFIFALTTIASGFLSPLLNVRSMSPSGYCGSDGKFNFFQTYNPWSTDHLFEITLGFGPLSFTHAKVIDVIWDVVIGRGGQFFLSIVTYRIFTKCLYRMLEQPNASVSYEAFRAIVFLNPSIESIWNLLQEIRIKMNWRARLSVLWFIMASIYVVAFSTIVSAMTGYSFNIEPLFTIGTDRLPISDDSFHRVVYMIRDAHRIEGANLSDNYLVGGTGFDYSRASPDVDYYQCCTAYHGDYASSRSIDISAPCSLAIAISKYITTYQLGPPQHTRSTLTFQLNSDESPKTYAIAPPTLDIQIFNTSLASLMQRSDNTVSIFYSELSQGYNASTNPSLPKYVFTGHSDIYDEHEMNENGSCDYVQQSYVWGFSFLLLFIFFIMTSVWTIGMYVLWNDAFWNSKLDRAGRQMGFYRGVVDVSNAMQEDMLSHPSELMSNKDIKQKLKERESGRRISYQNINHTRLPSARISEFQQWKRGVRVLNGWNRRWTLLHLICWALILATSFSIMSIGAFLSDSDSTGKTYTVGSYSTGLIAAVAAVGLIIASILPLNLLVQSIWRCCRRHRHPKTSSGQNDISNPAVGNSTVAAKYEPLFNSPRV